MKELERRMSRYEGIEMEIIPPELASNERELIFVTHDKCTLGNFLGCKFTENLRDLQKFTPKKINFFDFDHYL